MGGNLNEGLVFEVKNENGENKRYKYLGTSKLFEKDKKIIPYHHLFDITDKNSVLVTNRWLENSDVTIVCEV